MHINEYTIVDLKRQLSKIPSKPSIRVRPDNKQKLIKGLQTESSITIRTLFGGIDIIESETIPKGFAIFYQAKNNQGEPEIFIIKLE